MIIEMIQKENDIKKLDHTQLKELAEEIRGFLLDKISCTGGHLASNLGVVELTMAFLFGNLLLCQYRTGCLYFYEYLLGTVSWH